MCFKRFKKSLGIYLKTNLSFGKVLNYLKLIATLINSVELTYKIIKTINLKMFKMKNLVDLKLIIVYKR